MNYKFRKKSVVYFKHWTRKGYGVFASLHKVIKICTLCVSCSILVLPGKIAAQKVDPDSVIFSKDLPAVEIMDSEVLLQGSLFPIHLNASLKQDEIQQLPVLSVSELLEYLPGIDLRQRGPLSTQADVSYRGGNFDQTHVFINGINFSDPQTGHYALNLPFHAGILQKTNLYKNTSAFLFGSSALSGMINLVTVPEKETYVRLRMGGGMFGFWSAGADANIALGNTTHLVSVTREQSDGYRENTDFKTSQVYYHGTLTTTSGKIAVQMGYTDRNYGANSFYSPKFPHQHDHTQTLISSLQWENYGKLKIIPSVYYRCNKDVFQLVKDQPLERNNYHFSQVFGANVRSFVDYAWGRTAWSGDLRAEDVISRNLGEPLFSPIAIPHTALDYTHGRTRVHSSFSISQTYNYKNFGVAATLLVQHNSDLKDKIYPLPAIDLKYEFAPLHCGNETLKSQIIASASSSLRMPTFTDLYYKTGDILGNKNLSPEKAKSVEISFITTLLHGPNAQTFAEFRGNVYHRLEKDMIDYVKRDEDSIWHCINLSEIRFTGTELSLVLHPEALKNNFFIQKIQWDYSFIHSNQETNGYLSRYVLDHPEHVLQMRLQHRIYRHLTASWDVSYHNRKGEFHDFSNQNQLTPYPPYWLANVRLNYTHKAWHVFTEVLNIFNEHYFDYGNLEQPGVWFRAGINYTWHKHR